MSYSMKLVCRVFSTLALPAILLASCTSFSFAQMTPVGDMVFVFPLLAPRVSSNYGMRIHPVKRFSSKHNGVDLAAPEYSHVRAIASGTVVYADTYAGYGNLVTVVHDDKHTSLYGHLAEVLVNPGDKIEAGHLIGRLGSTGQSTGPHLHFEWRVEGVAVDPLVVFPSLATQADG